jgi:hypothetical protein
VIRRWLALLVFAVVGCSQGSSQQLATPKPSPSPSAVAATPTSPTPYGPYGPYLPRPVTTVNPAPPSPSGPLGFSCRLPLFTETSSANPKPQVGFLSVPDGSVTLGPAPATPAGNASAFYYDRAYSRWLPVGREAVSPDGRHYAYISYPAVPRGILTVVDVGTGAVRTFDATPAQSQLFYVVLDFAKEGIYLAVGYIEGPISGLWLMDPNTGAIRQVADLFDIRAIAGSVVWLGSLNPADPNPMGGLGVSPDSVDSFDIVAGSRKAWLYLPGQGVGVLAVDLAGHPIVQAGDSNNDVELLLLTSPGTADKIFQGPYTELPGLGRPIADSHGVWFGSSNGIYLDSTAVGLRKVSDRAGYPGNGCA